MTVMLVTLCWFFSSCWWYFQCHQHLTLVTDTFRFQHSACYMRHQHRCNRIHWGKWFLKFSQRYNVNFFREMVEKHKPIMIFDCPLNIWRLLTFRDRFWPFMTWSELEWFWMNLFELEKRKNEKKKLSRRSSNRLRMSLNVPGIWIT